MLLGCYRTGDANDPEVYIAAVVRALSGYPPDVASRVSDPLTGLPSKLKWLPSIPEILSACEEIEGPRRRLREWDATTERQLQERAEREARQATAPPPKLQPGERFTGPEFVKRFGGFKAVVPLDQPTPKSESTDGQTTI